MTFDGFAIVPPISPWDEKHRDAIEMDHARRTIGATPGEAWSIQVRRGLDNLDAMEVTRRTQYWHDRGYRLVRVRLDIIKETDDEDQRPRKATRSDGGRRTR